MTKTFKTCLLLEDDPEDQEFFMHTLRHVSPETGCYAASNGEEALSVLQQGLKPDIIFTDIDMPRMNGVEFIRKLKCIDFLRGIPVIVYSASHFDRDRHALKAMGVLAIYSKFNFQALPRILTRYFRQPSGETIL